MGAGHAILMNVKTSKAESRFRKITERHGCDNCDAIFFAKLSQVRITIDFVCFILKIWCIVTLVTPKKVIGVTKGVTL